MSRDIVNPFNGETIASVETTASESLPSIVREARAAQRSWRTTPLPERIAVVRRFCDALLAQADALATTLSQETGKPKSQALSEVKGTAERVDFFIDHVAERLEDVPQQAEGTEEILSREPLGVIANISAWNYPYFVGANVFVPALLAGNAVLYKPSEFAILTGAHIARVWDEACLPNSLFTLLIGDGALGKAILDEAIDGVFFTGSQATGERIATQVAARMIPMQLELGGKDPAYVCPDANVDAAAAALADGAFYNAGQSCCAVERIYVHESIHDAFVEAYCRNVATLNLGNPLDESTTLGPLTRPQQRAVLDAQVKDALAKGATLAFGGIDEAPDGNAYSPVVLTHVDHSMTIMRDESFGPIIGIQAVASDTEATTLMNDTTYGLTAAVYSRNKERARAILSELDTGSAYWNCCDLVSPRLPWSGRRQSGMGVTLSVHGIDAFTKLRGWHLRPPA